MKAELENKFWIIIYWTALLAYLPIYFLALLFPATILVFKKNRQNTDVLFIDASKEFTKNKNQNILEPLHIDKILTTYKNRKELEKYSHLATLKEI
ncbi:N-6 DNA methylase [Abyssogena phaseoliformis symbiont]|uniref:N-6 DNA methylase n=1 Tax=Abyssogena phaseoliformis symbiont TaxID=596095 RepID=UPI003CCA3BAE